jgi:hypothetical protein
MAGRSQIGSYTKPPRYAPQWYVGNLVFQGGYENIRIGSMTGGGQIYGHEYQGFQPPVIMSYATPLANLTAGGQIVAVPPSLQGLIGGSQGNGS